ncbi:CRISPR-associated RAMP protein, Cmr6 family [Saccharolobus islandicus L.D.8.5]|uniref:CRISPR-associated RAMP protein, Cmr6 family n=2 Tax=Saccharolobus islandicus TaxID=43080 RepID=D2PID7_SACI9|nr:type III-B CRISPR module RAMP protein Cmr6 [Sulfolobus islandicus]ADB86631.1 CRISPR-associated RAMP protein, Cmr6 family [Sulfolobus islandicus L.D.8.5]
MISITPRGTLLLNAINEYIKMLRNGLASNVKTNAKDNAMKLLVSSTLNISLVKDYVNDVENALKNSGLCYISLKFKTLSKFISGWSPIYFITEVPMSWDLILDIPYISGSTIKGIVRDYFKELTNDDTKTSCIFGDTSGVGKVIFFNAYPISSGQILDYDIITSHYNGADNEYDVNPVPIKFLAINEGVEFITFIAFDKKELEECGKDSLFQLLQSFLFSMKMGWGRRTSRGYGDLEIISKQVELKCPSS